MMPKSRKEQAMDYFVEGYNCTQSVVLAFKDLIDIDEEILIRTVSPFGGGMSRLREVCGAVSGMFFVAGHLYGYSDPKNSEEKGELYSRVQELAIRFENENKSIVCRELLGLDIKREGPIPEARTGEYYKKRPCKELIGKAAEILEQYIGENRK